VLTMREKVDTIAWLKQGVTGQALVSRLYSIICLLLQISNNVIYIIIDK